MSNKIRKRLRQTLDNELSIYKQRIANELQTHDKHMDLDDYIEFMQMYIATLTAELELSKLALEMEEMKR